MLGREKVQLSEWWELVTKVQTEMDAGELRGLCIRALDSYPDHPGLLLTRALAESMCSDHDEMVSSREIGRALRSGIEEYEISRADTAVIIDEMFSLASTRAPDLGAAPCARSARSGRWTTELSLRREQGLEKSEPTRQSSRARRDHNKDDLQGRQ